MAVQRHREGGMLEDVSVYQIEPIIRIQGGKVGNEGEGRINDLCNIRM